VLATVLLQHLTQMVLGIVFLDAPDTSKRTFLGQSIRFVGAMLCLDAWQFAFHRLMHEVDWLYKKVHIWHHKIFIPYSYAALYQHPLEMIIMDTLSGLIAVLATGALFLHRSTEACPSLDHGHCRCANYLSSFTYRRYLCCITPI
jgi:sphinganine C4-monooxygenase